MQTFLPYKDFKASAICLDTRRLNKQVVEAHQIIRTIDGITTGWSNHPAVKMWVGHREALYEYIQVFLEEAKYRGTKYRFAIDYMRVPYVRKYPEWLGDQAFHDSHKSNLLRKYYIWYSQFNWGVEPGMAYVWPGSD